ncbi:MAG: hypothetical protein AAB855_02315 [Patescibacteria group bacterium]
MKIKLPLLIIGILIGAGVVGAVTWYATREKAPRQIAPPLSEVQEQTIIGSYRCWQYNVSGGGGSCRLAPPFTFNADGTYQMSSERGTYTISDNTIILSESQIRGPGEILADGNQIRFEYDYQGQRHTVTYLREGSPSEGSDAGTPATVQVDITVNFSRPDGGVASSNSMSLVPEGYTFDDTPIRYDALASVRDRQIVSASFFGNKEVETGKIYEVYTDSGFEKLLVGTLDLRDASGPIEEVFTYEIP